MRRVLVVSGLLLALALPPARVAATERLCGEPKAHPDALYDRLAKDSRLREMHRNERYVALENGQDGTLWTFTLPPHPAHPAVVCRRVLERRGILEIPTAIACFGPEAQCTQLKNDFDALNERMIESLYKQRR
jgi:hypothetical protein